MILSDVYTQGDFFMIKIESLNDINNKDINEILDTWELSVRATHDFLSEDDIISIKPQVIEGVKYVKFEN